MAALGKIATRCRGGTALPRLCNLSRLCLPASRSLQVRYATSETVTHTGQVSKIYSKVRHNRDSPN